MYKYEHNISTKYIIERLFKEGLYYFDIRLFSYIFNLTPIKSSQWFKRLEEKGFIKEVEKGKYLLLGFQPQRVLSEPFFIGVKIHIPSYISFWSALNFYGFTEQVPKTIFIATTKRKNDVVFEGVRFRYIRLSSRKFFGYIQEKSGELSYLIAEPEKALIDSMDQPRYAGGMEEISKCIYNARDDIKGKKLIEYARTFGNKALNSRLGFIIEKIGMKAGKLLQSISRPYVKLDPQKKNSNIWDKKWHVNVNIKLDEIFESSGVI